MQTFYELYINYLLVMMTDKNAFDQMSLKNICKEKVSKQILRFFILCKKERFINKKKYSFLVINTIRLIPYHNIYFFIIFIIFN